MSIELKKYMNPGNIKGPTMDTIILQEERQIENLNSNINISLNETFIKRAQSIGLTILEKEFGLKVDNTLTMEERRKRLLAKKRGTGTTTIEAIKNICNAYADNTEVVEHTSEYWFELLLESYNGFLTDIES
ncbi:putative phage tail protein, partial [Clostridium sp.]|uniref:putative phage tail protein n=1 Tax=Clostridium sp. TaxID=1506 RepID=UPI002915AABD